LKDIRYYKNGKIFFTQIDPKGQFMTPSKPKSLGNTPKIMVMDLETRTDKSGILIPICLSVYEGTSVKTFLFTNK
jgi:hypothetical protein